MQSTDIQRKYWRTNKILTTSLLVIWFIATFGVSYFARDLNFTFFGWPFSFWMGAQGALGVYVAIIGFYAWYMNRLDAAQRKAYGKAPGGPNDAASHAAGQESESI